MRLVSEFTMQSLTVQNVIFVLHLHLPFFFTIQGIIESLADDFVVTETAEAVEVAIAKSARLSVKRQAVSHFQINSDSIVRQHLGLLLNSESQTSH